MNEYLLGLLEKLVNIDSGTGEEEGLDQVAAIVKVEFERLRFHWQVFQASDGSRHHYAHTNVGDTKNEGGPDILLIAHLDTVFPKGTARKRGFTRDGDLARGPGVSDCKAGVVTIIGALQKLNEAANAKLPGVEIGCLFNTDEEIGSPGSRIFIEKLARQSKVVLVVEPAEGENITLSRKGIGRFRLQVFGKAAHSGSNYQDGSSAIVTLAQQIIDIHHLTRIDEGITFNTGVVSGGTRSNVVPDYAEADIDLRITHTGQISKVFDNLERITGATMIPGTTAKLTGGITRPPMPETPENVGLYIQMRKIASEMGISLGTFQSGGGSDANFTAALGIPTLDGVGPIGGGHHSESEFLNLPSLVQRIDLLARFLSEFEFK